LTLVAGLGHWMLGSVDWHIFGPLLVGSLPGIFLGSYLSARVAELALRIILRSLLQLSEASSPSSRYRTASRPSYLRQISEIGDPQVLGSNWRERFSTNQPQGSP
jgi:hypothetical protein